MGSGGRQNEDGLRTQRGARGQSRGRRWGAGTQGQGLGGRKRRKGRPALSVAKQDGGCPRGRPPRAAAASPAPACRRRLIRGRPRRSRPRRLLQGREVSRPGHRPAGPLTRPRRRAAAGRQAPSTTTSPREGPGAFVSGLPASAAPPQTACHSGDRTRPADVPALASRAHRDTPVAPSLYPSGLPAAPLPPQLTCPSRGQAWRRTGRPGRG